MTTFDVAASSVPQPTVDDLAGLEWVRMPEDLCLVGPAGTHTSHLRIAAGHAAVQAGHRVGSLTAAELVETLSRSIADHSVGRVIDSLLRNDVVPIDEVGSAPLDATGTQLPLRFTAAAHQRRAPAIASQRACNNSGRNLPEHTTATSLPERLLHHAVVILTDGDSYRMRTPGEGPTTQPHPATWGISPGQQ